MHNALILNGKNNVGKSTTLYELIKLFPTKNIIYKHNHRLYKNSTRKYPEYTVVLKHKNKIICITTKGDDYKTVMDELDGLNPKGYDNSMCDLFVCASHDGGKLIKYLLNDFDKKVFVTKQDIKNVSKRDKACKDMAKYLYKEAMKLL